MKPVIQQKLHDPSKDIVGDCFRACVASMLELDLERVPEFEEDMRDDDSVQWFYHLIYWCYYVHFTKVEYFKAESSGHVVRPGAYYIVGGTSPRFHGENHAVIYKDGELVHDPHPEGTGIVGTPKHYMYFQYIGRDNTLPWSERNGDKQITEALESCYGILKNVVGSHQGTMGEFGQVYTPNVSKERADEAIKQLEKEAFKNE